MKYIHVVAAVIRGYSQNLGDKILISKRPDHVHQGGKWEFPGGKVETGEAPVTALIRELEEELGITATQSEPLIQIHHEYSDKSVFLDVWEVLRFEGEPHGAEGQLVEWVEPADLARYEFPAANVPIVSAAILPKVYWITPEPQENIDAFLELVEHQLKAGIRLVQFRAKALAPDDAFHVCEKVAQLCKQYGAILYLNGDTFNAIASSVGRDVEHLVSGIHLTSRQLQAPSAIKSELPCAASCHSRADIEAAELRFCKFVTLSPIRDTLSHPGAVPLKHEDVAQWVSQAKIPVYALGGMSNEDALEVRGLGFQGVSGIRRV